MNDRPINYTTSELGIILTEMHGDILEIKEQVKTTNGRVKSLELWKQFLLGAWAVVSIATPLLWYYVNRSIDDFKASFDRNVSSIVQDAINKNNDKFFDK